jgi:hypothetical protein
MIFYFEAFSYAIYMYFLVFLFLFIKPNYLTISLLFLYCFLTTWYGVIGCKKKIINIFNIKLIIVTLYSLLCCFVYYLIHHYYHYNIIKVFVILMPITYYILIKFIEQYFTCGQYHVITTPLRFLNFFINKM